LRVNSSTKLQIIGPKVPNPWFIRQMLGEAFNDLVFPQVMKTSMFSLGSIGMYMMVWRLSNIAPHYSWYFLSNISTKPLKRAMRKGKWAFDHCPTSSWPCIKYQIIIISTNNTIYNGECGIKFWNGWMYVQTKNM